MRTALLGLLGLALAVAVGFSVHLVTRGTISLPVVQLDQPAPVPPRTTATTAPTTTTTAGRTEIERGTTTEDQTEVETEVETQDSSSRGRGRGRGRSGGDSGGNSGSGGGDD